MRATSRLDATTATMNTPDRVPSMRCSMQARVLVDVVDTDRIAVDGTPDRDEELEEAAGHRRQAVDRARRPGRRPRCRPIRAMLSPE